MSYVGSYIDIDGWKYWLLRNLAEEVGHASSSILWSQRNVELIQHWHLGLLNIDTKYSNCTNSSNTVLVTVDYPILGFAMAQAQL